MRSVHRLASAAFLTDMAVYLVMLSLPYRLLRLGASPLVLGLAPAVYSAPYAITALGAGALSDRWARRTLIRAGSILAAAAACAMSVAGTVTSILLLVGFMGLGLAFFWPSLQAAFSEIDAGRELPRNVGLYNVSWSTGKGVGFLCGGILLQGIGATAVAAVAGAALMGAAAVLPYLATPGDHSQALKAEGDVPAPAVRNAYRTAAWVANGMTFGLSATLNHQYPKLLLEHGVGAGAFGSFLAVVFFAQTATFVLLRRWTRWRYRASALVATQLSMLLLALAMPHIPSLRPLLLVGPLLGAGLGFCYHSSLYYSLHAPQKRGRRTGIHESVLHMSAASIPLVGGAAVRRWGSLDAPYVVAAAALALSTVATGFVLLRAAGRGRYVKAGGG
jgi:MFS family permease